MGESENLQPLVVAGGVAAGAVVGWLLGRSQRNSGARQTLGGNHTWMSREDICLVSGLIAAGYGHLFAHWPTPGTNDEEKRNLLIMVVATLSKNAQNLERFRIRILPKPIARRHAFITARHDDARDDPYYWLRDDLRVNPFVLDHLKEENAYTKAMLTDTEHVQKLMVAEMFHRVPREDQSAPLRIKNYTYYIRRVPGKSYPIHCRRRVNEAMESHFQGRQSESGMPEEMLLDENVEVRHYKFFKIDGITVSPSESLIAYFQDIHGNSSYALKIRQIRSGKHLVRHREADAWNQCVWSADSKALFYLKVDPLGRPFKVLRHRLAESMDKDVCLYTEADCSCHLSLYKTRDQSTVVVCTVSKFFTECRVLNTANPDGEFSVVLRRADGVFYWLQRYEDIYIFRIQDKNRINSEITFAPIDSPESQKVLVLHRGQSKIDEFVVSRRSLTLFCRRSGSQTADVYVLNHHTEQYLAVGTPVEIRFEEAVFSLRPAPQGDFDSELLRYYFSSPTTPESVVEHHLGTCARSIAKMNVVAGLYDPRMFRSERTWAQAADGAKIPISVVYKIDSVRHDGSDSLVLEVYGAHERSLNPEFSSERLSLLLRGVVYATAHVRGGGEMGRAWYENGRLLKKRTTFSDTIACARHLKVQKYCGASKLCICGSAAGGLTVGAVLNACPDLFRAAILRSPSVDILTSLIDRSQPFSPEEPEDAGEYGDPDIEEYYRYIKGYSPMDNIDYSPYPHVLATTRYFDSRIGFWGPAKYIAKLRSCTTSENMVLLTCCLDGGLSAEQRLTLKYKEAAQEYAFILKTLEMLPPRENSIGDI